MKNNGIGGIFMRFFLLLVISFIHTPLALPQVEPDWSSSATNAGSSSTGLNSRENIYQWPTQEAWEEQIRRGKIHALRYPVETTGLLMPARSTLKVLNAKPGEPLFEFIKVLLSLKSDFKDFKGFW